MRRRLVWIQDAAKTLFRLTYAVGVRSDDTFFGEDIFTTIRSNLIFSDSSFDFALGEQQFTIASTGGASFDVITNEAMHIQGQLQTINSPAFYSGVLTRQLIIELPSTPQTVNYFYEMSNLGLFGIGGVQDYGYVLIQPERLDQGFWVIAGAFLEFRFPMSSAPGTSQSGSGTVTLTP